MASRVRVSTAGSPANRSRSRIVASAAKITPWAAAMTLGSSGGAPEAPWTSTSISCPLALAATSRASAAISLWAIPVGQLVTATSLIAGPPCG